MSIQQKREIARQEQSVRQHGKPYYPYIFVRDAVAALILFLVLVAISAFVGITPQAPANPADSSYVPHPEWFFLFFYEIVKYFPGSLSTVAVVGLPALVFGGLLLLPWIDRRPERHPRQRAGIMAVMTFGWFIILGFSALSFISAPPVLVASQPIPGVNVSIQSAHPGQQLYVDNCGGCHGEFGEGGPNPSRPGSILSPISNQEFLISFNDDTLFNIIVNGLPERGMVGFSLRTGGPLDDQKIEQIVNYIRAWQDNPPVVAAYVPPTATPRVSEEGVTIPSFEQGVAVNGAALYKDWCANCHGKDGTTTVGLDDIFIVDPQYLAGVSDEHLIEAITTGFPLPYDMPAYRDILSSQEISDLLAWLRSFEP